MVDIPLPRHPSDDEIADLVTPLVQEQGREAGRALLKAYRLGLSRGHADSAVEVTKLHTDLKVASAMERVAVVAYIRGEAEKLRDLAPSYNETATEFMALAGEIEKGTYAAG